jgi:hypothetical protein
MVRGKQALTKKKRRGERIGENSGQTEVERRKRSNIH